MKKPSFKKGDMVNFKTGNKTLVGHVVAPVKPGDKPDFTAKKFTDYHKRGLSQAKQRDEKTYLVVSGGQLYWPKKVW